ncbi:MAG: peptide chain release factor 1 [Elusimicrobia bacterium RIFCSPLOWO2_01_FULL_54_10]|nr:MAG: peptide chain release factor 1 [Elusimicrobia bacterium RIFCSPLOWO2_01_FULL_54_10]
MNDDKLRSMAKPILSRHREIEEMMRDPHFHERPDFAALSKEHRLLSTKTEKIRQWESLVESMKHADELAKSGDAEMEQMARAEKTSLAEQIPAIEKNLWELLRPKDPLDSKNVILEIRAGTGGEEAALFASDLARMYLRFAEEQGFRHELVDVSLTGRGGFKEAIYFIETKPGRESETGPYGLFKFERGIHRVQRVPETEASGRIHTSAVTVAVLPEAEEVDVQIRPEDIRVDTYRASGAGGQHINKTDSAVRMTHIPTGVVVQCQEERSQIKNREKALKFLRAKILDDMREKEFDRRASDRKKQVGSGDRSEKIRTYNFPQDRITDHRIGFTVHNMPEILDGKMGALVDALRSSEEDLGQ